MRETKEWHQGFGPEHWENGVAMKSISEGDNGESEFGADVGSWVWDMP